jgi:gas vesicle protein
MSDDHRGGDAKFLVGLFIGGIIGALIIFFLGTKEGKKAGKFLEDKSKDTLDDLHDQIDELEKKGQELVTKGEEIKDQVIEQFEEKKEEITERATEKLDDALAQVEKLQEQGRDTTAELRKRIFKNIPKRR